MTRTGDREIRSVSGRLPDNPGELACMKLGKRIKKHLFARILEQNKQRNQLFLYVPKSADNCYLIPVDNKNSIFIPGQRKNRYNHFLEVTNGLVSKERICGLTSSTKYEPSLVFCFLVVDLFRSRFVSVLDIGPPGIM